MTEFSEQDALEEKERLEHCGRKTATRNVCADPDSYEYVETVRYRESDTGDCPKTVEDLRKDGYKIYKVADNQLGHTTYKMCRLLHS